MMEQHFKRLLFELWIHIQWEWLYHFRGQLLKERICLIFCLLRVDPIFIRRAMLSRQVDRKSQKVYSIHLKRWNLMCF